jgi:hypothetical protein
MISGSIGVREFKFSIIIDYTGKFIFNPEGDLIL